MSDEQEWPRYRVTYQIEVNPERGHYVTEKGETVSTFGLIAFTRDCPPTHHNATKRQLRHAEEHNYWVVSCETGPWWTRSGYTEMDEHRAAGGGGEYVTYRVPAALQRWLERMLERSQYAVVTEDDVFKVVTQTEAEALALEALEAEIAEGEE